ncbi:VOC family protein [Actinotalea ferrariae]|uniref:glyoxalase superfamily protein n=1 Tax=Actinotalea ferrariae TaxID=1386098 RepID=UPI001C8B3B8B|nr:glyoxalase superfamily protein [Actinotalea ferrariae]MBX9245537.1 VOC family protein [Actinotalea ferrariae]
MAITHVRLLSLPVRDQDRARAFYVDVLGFEVVRDNPMGPDRWVEVGLPGGQTSITLVTWFPTMPPGSSKGLVLESDDLDADVAELERRGVALADGGIQEAPWGRFVTFDDPDGNGIVVQATRSGA